MLVHKKITGEHTLTVEYLISDKRPNDLVSVYLIPCYLCKRVTPIKNEKGRICSHYNCEEIS